jgi:hypothetical protein
LPRFRFLSACLLVLAVSACAETEAPEPLVYQAPVEETNPKARHWDMLADDNAAAIAEAARRFPGAGSYFVEPLDATMPFARTFRDQLTTHMVRRGLTVSLARADAAYRVHFAVQPLRREVNKPEPGAVFLGSTVLGGLRALRGIDRDYVGASNLVIIGAALEMANSGAFGFGPTDEVSVTVTVLKGTDILHRGQALYTVDRKEAHLYAGTTPAAPLGVVSSASGEPMPVREFSINGR